MYYKVFTGKTSFPEPVTLNGTFYSNGINITTNIASTLLVGNYLYSTSNNEVRLVVTNPTANTFTIDKAFTLNVSSDSQDAIKICDTSISYENIEVTNIGGAEGLINGNSMTMGQIVKINQSGVAFTVDGTGTKLSIQAL